MRGFTEGAREAARIDGLDVARAVAILGMIAAHIGDDGSDIPWSDGWPWLVVSHGFPSSLFAVLAGVSMTMMVTSRGTVAVRDIADDHLTRTQIRIAVRGLILIVLGAGLELLETFVAIILTTLGVLFLIALPLLRLSSRVLVPLAAALVLAGSWIARELGAWAWEAGIGDVPVLDTFWSARYPIPVWMAYLLLGLVIGRLDLRADRSAGRLVLAGAGLAGIARSSAYLLERAAGPAPEWLATTSHSYTPVEMTQNIGIAMATIGACLWAARRAPRVLWPLRATGAMALTLYTAQIVVIAIVGNEMIHQPSNLALVVVWATFVGFACAWRAWLGQGPLERLMTVAGSAAVRAWAPEPARR